MYIALSKGYWAVVDTDDPTKPWRYKWSAEVHKDGTVYAKRVFVNKQGKKEWQYLHRFIFQEFDQKVLIDHRDRNGLNNRRSNLRRATKAQNAENSTVRKDNTSGIKGVTWNALAGKWQAQIGIRGKVLYLGLFSRIQEAAKARKKAAQLQQKEFFREK